MTQEWPHRFWPIIASQTKARGRWALVQASYLSQEEREPQRHHTEKAGRDDECQ